jgi:hypothetical protein
MLRVLLVYKRFAPLLSVIHRLLLDYLVQLKRRMRVRADDTETRAMPRLALRDDASAAKS